MKFIKWLDENLEKTMCVALLMLIAGFTFVNVVMRYVFKNGISWATEATLFAFAYFVWFAISYGFKLRSHVNVTAVVNLLPRKGQIILGLAVQIIELVGFIYVAYWGLRLITDASVVGKYGLLIHYPRWTLYLSTPIGAVLSAVRVVQNFVQDLKQLKSPPESGAGEKEEN